MVSWWMVLRLYDSYMCLMGPDLMVLFSVSST